jgi:hypothetical protein
MSAAATPKHQLSTLSIVFFVGLALLFDLIKFLLLFLDFFPPAIPFDEIITFIVSALAIGSVFGGLWAKGAYKNKKAFMGMLFTFGGVVVDLSPFLDHLPATTAAAVAVIIRSRVNDKLEYQTRLKKLEHAEQQQAEQEAKAQAAHAAQERVLAANDNANRNSRLNAA